MRANPRIIVILIAIAISLSLLLSGCAAGRSDLKFAKDNMLHAQQVLERYDENGNPVPQYLELWLAEGKGRCSELDAGGREIAVALDTGKDHLYWDTATLDAEQGGVSRVFLVSLAAMKKLYPKTQEQNTGTYAGRACDFYLLGGSGVEDWVKLYVDKQTGMVLLCDAETFRLRTALLEVLTADDSLFVKPEGLKFKGGAGK